VLRCSSPAIPNAIAGLLLDLRDRTGTIPHAYFGWTEGNPVTYLLKFLAFGEGDTAPVCREVLRKAEPNQERRPRVHVGEGPAPHRIDLMTHPILGLHHVTATVNDAQADLDFCLDLLGMRLVKKTVNFDNHDVYHFYYGTERGVPGTIWTTFPYKGLRRACGRQGHGPGRDDVLLGARGFARLLAAPVCGPRRDFQGRGDALWGRGAAHPRPIGSLVRIDRLERRCQVAVDRQRRRRDQRHSRLAQRHARGARAQSRRSI
jgi:catechol 2,3-dioxygenase-like lactoylglutathione lyase family enzyme